MKRCRIPGSWERANRWSAPVRIEGCRPPRCGIANVCSAGCLLLLPGHPDKLSAPGLPPQRHRPCCARPGGRLRQTFLSGRSWNAPDNMLPNTPCTLFQATADRGHRLEPAQFAHAGPRGGMQVSPPNGPWPSPDSRLRAAPESDARRHNPSPR